MTVKLSYQSGGTIEDEVKAALADAKPAVEKARSMAAKTGKENRKAAQLAKDAEYNYLFVLHGKGVHNVEYSVDVLKKAKADAQAAVAAGK